MNLQPHLQNEIIRLVPLTEGDFEALYAVASDPLIWEQHPNPLRYERAEFQTYFQGAVQSRGALLVYDAASSALIGSSRFYDLDTQQKTVLIGYTFLARSHWGGRYNAALKKLMLDHAFSCGMERVQFHIGACNVRSQTAMARLGGVKVGEITLPYFGEAMALNYVYEMTREGWIK